VRDQEEIEASINNFLLFDESMVNIGSLGRVEEFSWPLLLEEPLSDSLVDKDKGNLWWLALVALGDDSLKLFQLVLDDL